MFAVWHQVPAPKDISDEELLKLLETEDPSGFRIPMSLGEPHAELDKGAVTLMIPTTYSGHVLYSQPGPDLQKKNLRTNLGKTKDKV